MSTGKHINAEQFMAFVAGEIDDIGVNGSGQNGSQRHARGSTIPNGERVFIAWDGEGTRRRGDDGETPKFPQEYSLFGCSTDAPITDESLSTFDCLGYIINIGRRYPNAYHVGFAFDYDSNMILRRLTPNQLRKLRDKGSVLIANYRVEHVLGKWLQVTQYGPRYRGGNKRDKFTVRIADIFGFFQCSFLQAIRSYIPDHPLMDEIEIIERGKAERNRFAYDRIADIEAYWKVEIALLEALVCRLRDMLYSVSLNVNRWHGPGAIANYVFRTRGIAHYKALTPEKVREASRYGYAGGRFELFRLGRHQHVYSIDINSAYPAAISRLPGLHEGTWQHVDHPRSVAEFGIYHVKLAGFPGPVKKPSPLFHRDMAHNISYPWMVEGWYWTPEVRMLLPLLDKRGFEIVEGYEYVGWHTRPFAFVADMYYERKRLKAEGNGAQMALKLALNSLYGKMAQRVGWERNGRPPTWHQLEWAGYVTSATRARLFGVMARIGWNDLIAVETDGIYTTADPNLLGIENSAELGAWEVSEYEEMLYVQSGVYFARDRDKGWIGKYRGLDNGTLTANSIADYLRSLKPNPNPDDPWRPITGPTTRFIGYRAAIQREDTHRGPMKVHHCMWETVQREISPGEIGKRVHSPKLCAACRAGKNAYDMPHDLVIRSRSIGDPRSAMHSIPWEDRDNGATAEWRQYAAEREDMLI